jgi:hypothetical protein
MILISINRLDVASLSIHCCITITYAAQEVVHCNATSSSSRPIQLCHNLPGVRFAATCSGSRNKNCSDSITEADKGPSCKVAYASSHFIFDLSSSVYLVSGLQPHPMAPEAPSHALQA